MRVVPCPACHAPVDRYLGITRVEGAQVRVFCSEDCKRAGRASGDERVVVIEAEEPAPETRLNQVDGIPEAAFDVGSAHVEAWRAVRAAREAAAIAAPVEASAGAVASASDAVVDEPDARASGPETAEAAPTPADPAPDAAEPAAEPAADRSPPSPESGDAAVDARSIPATALAGAPTTPRRRPRSTFAGSLVLSLGAALLGIGVYLLIAESYSQSAARAQRVAVETAPAARPMPPAPVVTKAPAAKPVPQKPSLLEIRYRALKQLEGFLHSSGVRHRATAAEMLAADGHLGALALLRQELRASRPLSEWPVKQLFAEALARLGHREGLRALIADLNSRRSPVRRAAAVKLARMGDRSGLKLLTRLARQRYYRLPMAALLLRFGDKWSRKLLRRTLKKSKLPYRRFLAAVALGQVGDRSGIELLRKQMKRPDVHIDAVLALQKLGVTEAKAALRRALVPLGSRVAAARALRAYGDVTPVRDLEPYLESPSEESRLMAAAAIVTLTSQATAER